MVLSYEQNGKRKLLALNVASFSKAMIHEQTAFVVDVKLQTIRLILVNLCLW